MPKVKKNGRQKNRKPLVAGKLSCKQKNALKKVVKKLSVSKTHNSEI